jgi:hypothetical protein
MMTALTTLGVLCLGLICLVPSIGLTVDLYQKPQPTKILKNGKRELKINRVIYWDYLIILLPASLLGIAFLSPDLKEKAASLKILGIGYMVLVLSPYNRRIDIPKVNLLVAVTCVILALIAYALTRSEVSSDYHLYVNSETLFFPALAYTYLMLARQLINHFFSTYPLTLDKSFRIGHFSYRYNRRANILDLIWTLFNIIVVPFMIYSIIAK